MSENVYLNGRIVPYDEAKLPVEDRATLFADGVYEVIRYYGGHSFLMDAHLERLERSLREIRLPAVDLQQLAEAGEELARANGVHDGNLYVQISRGVAPRTHAFPDGVEPTVFMTARETARPAAEYREGGISCITLPDLRWLRCDIKSLSLLPNILAKQQAKEAGAFEALLVRDGFLTEGTSSNLFAVIDGALYTHPEGPHILSGVTRRVVLALAREEGIPVHTTKVALSSLERVDELLISGTNTEVLGVVQLDGRPVGRGEVGPVTRRLIERFDGLVEAARGGARIDILQHSAEQAAP